MSNNEISQDMKTLLRKTYTILIFAVITWVVTIVFGYPITATLGPGTSGIVTVIITTIIMVVGIRVANNVWAPIGIVTLFSILAIPFPFFGPQGWQKIILGFLVGVIYTFSLTPLPAKRRSVQIWRMTIIAALATCASLWIMFLIMQRFNLPGAEKLKAFVGIGSTVYGVLGGIGAFLGEMIYDRYIKNLSAAKQLQD
jgi:hypothetical protein